MKLLLAASILATALLGGGVAQAAPRPRVHVVYPGQTLGMIAKRYRVSVAELCRANALRKCRTIQPGLRLRIPVPGEAPPPAPAGREPRPASVAPARAAAGSPGRADTSEPEPQVPAPEAGAAPASSARTQPSRATEPGRPAAGEGKATSRAGERAETKRAGAKGVRRWRRGWVRLSSLMGSYEGPIFDRHGRVTREAQRGLTRVFASWRTGARSTMHPRLLRLLVRVSDRFEGRPLRVVSGYRPYSPTQYTPHSRHNDGHAVDFSVEGVPNTTVRDFCRSLPSVGVGYYPNSSFIHLDVREASAYWIDYSGPGERPRYADSRGRDPGRGAARAEAARPLVPGADMAQEPTPRPGAEPAPEATADDEARGDPHDDPTPPPGGASGPAAAPPVEPAGGATPPAAPPRPRAAAAPAPR
ncbi:MAG: DUF882 domain-containing protein [Polyangiaceae bacterium]|nr:DUF882 domain-containing protein [Polyangiaceae bacterium]